FSVSNRTTNSGKLVASSSPPPSPKAERRSRQTALLDILKDVKSSLDALKARDEERADELRNIRRLVDERGKEVDLLRGMFADYIGKDCPQSSDSKVYPLTKREEDRYRPDANRDKSSRIPSPQCRSKRLYSPPPRNATKVLRTGYADRRRDADKFESSRWRDSPGRTDRVRETAAEQAKHREEVKRREPRGAKFTEKVTVERSIRCSPPELAQYSVDTRRNAGDLNDSDVEDERIGRKYGSE
ncbi:hypothetical protein TELCIR_05353, partial [Teladorsagia circumcincta]